MTEITPEAQEALMMLQTGQQQMQGIIMQKDALNSQESEIEKALEELSNVKDDDVYKAVGPILIKSTRTVLEKELKEKKETISVRLRSLENEEKLIKDRMEEQQKKLQNLLKTNKEDETDAG